MKTAVVNVESRLNILQGQIFVACRLGARCFAENKKLYFSTAPNQNEYQTFLQADGCMEYIYQQKEPDAHPHILNGMLGLSWIAEWVHLHQGGSFLVVLGPVYLQNSSAELSLKQLQPPKDALSTHRQYLNALNDVPVLDWFMLRQYAGMLHFTIYEESIDGDSLTPESPTSSLPSSEEKKESTEKIPSSGNDFQRMAEYERMLLEYLGKSTTLKVNMGNYPGELQDFHLNDLLRQVKDNIIIFTALCARNAVVAGVPLYSAKTTESDWINKVEQSKSPAEASKLLRGMYQTFSHMVQSHQEVSGLSKAVRECRDYIRMNYTKDLKLDEIAKRVGYTEYYLTRKFFKETGEKLTDYIRSVRIDAAKALLITSKKDIQAISEELQFGSRSYFDRVFRQAVGISPAMYREKMGRSII